MITYDLYKKDLAFYISTDLMMNRGRFKNSLSQEVKELFIPDKIMCFLRTLRHLEYCINSHGSGIVKRFLLVHRLNRLGMQLEFTIPCNVFGYGLVIPHYGTIVVGGGGNQIGNYAVLHTSTCITAGKKRIGDGLYVSTGAKLLNDIVLSENVIISANSLVNKSFTESNILLTGAPAKIYKSKNPWYFEDTIYYDRKQKCDKLRFTMFGNS